MKSNTDAKPLVSIRICFGQINNQDIVALFFTKKKRKEIFALF